MISRKLHYKLSFGTLNGTKTNDIGLCLEVVLTPYVNHCITFAVEYLANR